MSIDEDKLKEIQAELRAQIETMDKLWEKKLAEIERKDRTFNYLAEQIKTSLVFLKRFPTTVKSYFDKWDRDKWF